MKAELLFGVWLPYIQTEYEPLKKYLVRAPIINDNRYDYFKKKWFWIFKYDDIKDIESLLGTIEIPEFRDKFKTADVPVPKFKGKDFVQVIEYPKIYQIIEHRKQDGGEVEEQKHNIDKEIVNKVWEVIKRQQLNRQIKTRTVAEKVCNHLSITRFHRETGTFDFAKLFGNRSSYMKYVYYPLKVLVHQKKVHHHKSGMVERLK